MAERIEEKDVVEPLRRRIVEGPWVEPSPRRVRVYFNGVAVADSRHVLLAFEAKRLPVYWFPQADVSAGYLWPAGHTGSTPSRAARFDVVVGERRAEKAAWTYPDPEPGLEVLKDHIAFYWKEMDSWYEEDDEVFVHPRDPYHRVDVLHSSRHVRVEIGGQVVAESSRPCLLFETGLPTRYYLPKLDVRMDLMQPSRTTSQCPYKGIAVYWTMRDGPRDILWGYPFPIPECPKIENMVSFYNEKVDITVDGELQPRPVTIWS
jgi:uncharacterized protein (DUF427 family)